MAKIIPRISITLPNGAAAEVLQSSPAAISPNEGVYQGELCMVKVVTPNFTNTVTTIIRIYDRNGIKLWQSDPLPENSGAKGYAIPVDVPLTYGEKVSAQPSGDPGGTGGIVTIDMDYIPDHFIGVY